MIARAKFAFSGMVISVMIAAPALTLNSGTAFAAAERSSHHPRPSARKAYAGSELRRGHAAHAELGHLGSSRVAYRTARRGGAYESISETAFVNDSGSVHNAMHDEARGTSIHTGMAQTGMASWYGGSRWQGNRTSSGARYDDSALTAAHATLPLGSYVRVSMADGSGSVVVQITDRPGTRRRIIDLSRAAASRIGLINRGVAMVSLETP